MTTYKRPRKRTRASRMRRLLDQMQDGNRPGEDRQVHNAAHIVSTERGRLFAMMGDGIPTPRPAEMVEFTDGDVRVDLFNTADRHQAFCDWINERGYEAKAFQFMPDIPPDEPGGRQQLIIRFANPAEGALFKMFWC